MVMNKNKDNVRTIIGDNERSPKKTGKITQASMMQALDWAYGQTISGVKIFGQKDIYEFVAAYVAKYGTEQAIDKMIAVQTNKAAVSGFVTGFGGILTIPITLPANVYTVILFQIRMIAAIALMRGYDLNDDEVQTFVYTTLAGASLGEIAKKTGIQFGNKLTVNLIKKLPGTVLVKINQAVGFRLATKFGSKGLVNLGKMVPVIGAVIGGGFDTVTTLAIAKQAKKTFTTRGIDIGDGTLIQVSQ